MKPSEVGESVRLAIRTNLPLWIWGPPGVGKSAVVRQVAAAEMLELVDLRASLLDPVDLRGIPCPDLAQGVTRWIPPAFLPRKGAGILFLDEIAQAPAAVQAALLQLTLDRRVGEYALPEDWAIICASNRREDRAGVGQVITPLLSRMVHVDFDHDGDEWQAWAGANGVAHEIRTYLRTKPDMLLKFDAKAGKRASPSPRGWEMASRLFQVINGAADLLFPLMAGCVGEGAAAEVIAHIKLAREIDPEAVLSNPAKAHVPKETAVLHALCGALVSAAGKGNPRWGALFQFAERMPEEFAVYMVRDALMTDRKLIQSKDCQAWVTNHRALFLGEFGGAK